MCYINNRGVIVLNNKGFTLIELLLTIAVLSIIIVSFVMIVNNSFGLTKEKSYEIIKKSIISQVNEYIYECDNHIIECNNDYVWLNENDKFITSFKLDTMKKYGYFTSEYFINPITNNYIGDCLVINVVKDKYSLLNISLEDKNCN